MTNGWGKYLMAGAAGILLAFALLLTVQTAANALAPVVFDPNSGDILIPLGATVALLFGWVLAGFCGGWLAARIAASNGPAFVVGGAIAGAAIYQSVSFGDAAWVMAAGVIVPMIAVWAAGRAALAD